MIFKTKVILCFPGVSVVKNSLPVQETQDRFLIWGNLTCRGATKPVCATAIEPVLWAWELQWLKPALPRVLAPRQEKSLQWETRTLQPEGSPHSLQPEEAHAAAKTRAKTKDTVILKVERSAYCTDTSPSRNSADPAHLKAAFVPGIHAWHFLTPVIQWRMDGFIVRLCKTVCRFPSLPRISQALEKEKSWIVLINNIKCLHFGSLLYYFSPLWKCHSNGVCYLCLVWRCYGNSKHSAYSFYESSDCWVMSAALACSEEVWRNFPCQRSHSLLGKPHGTKWLWRWWLRIPFLDLTSGEDGSLLGSLCCLGLSYMGLTGWLHISCPRWLLFSSGLSLQILLVLSDSSLLTQILN